MFVEFVVLGIVGTFVIFAIGFMIYRKLPKKLKADRFNKQWKDLQTFCKDKTTWPDALNYADALLDKALKKRKYKGKTMGERLVSAQRIFTDNDGIWFAHNFYKKVANGDIKRIKEEDIKEALVAYRQALRDLGALPQ